jgi:formate-dependent nitrite reductase cytochrome c552 subunit
MIMLAIMTVVGISSASSEQDTQGVQESGVASVENVPVADASTLPKDNGLCLICHLDFAYDPLAGDHLKAGISCAHCHGTSYEHMSDETLMTSPDILHGRKEVDRFCGKCHDHPHRNKLDAVVGFRKQWTDKKRENGRGVSAESVCTDCHGLHTIARR